MIQLQEPSKFMDDPDWPQIAQGTASDPQTMFYIRHPFRYPNLTPDLRFLRLLSPRPRDLQHYHLLRRLLSRPLRRRPRPLHRSEHFRQDAFQPYTPQQLQTLWSSHHKRHSRSQFHLRQSAGGRLPRWVLLAP